MVGLISKAQMIMINRFIEIPQGIAEAGCKIANLRSKT